MPKKDELEDYEKPLTLREKIAIRLLLFILVIVKPNNYNHEYGKLKEQILEDIEKNK